MLRSVPIWVLKERGFSSMAKNEHILRLSNISKFFGDVQAVKDITIDIKEGELISFIGPSGCGKTTLLRIIGGFEQQSTGTVKLDGVAIDHLPPEKRVTAMVFQDYALFPHMTVFQNVSYGLDQKKMPKAEKEQAVKEILEQVRLGGYEGRKPRELSGGEQQRVAVARCLVLKPRILLLDEPLSNLDANLRLTMREEIRRLKDELKLTIIFVTHDQDEAMSISDRILVLNKGEQQQLDSPNNVYRYPCNKFVANFVGQSNVLEGDLEAVDKTIYFVSEGLKVEVDPSLPPSKNVAVSIRPETIKLNQSSPNKGKVMKISHGGNIVSYYISIGNQEIKVDDFDVSFKSVYTRGSIVGIDIPKDIHLLN